MMIEHWKEVWFEGIEGHRWGGEREALDPACHNNILALLDFLYDREEQDGRATTTLITALNCK